jgi:hypothetical protein
MTDRLITDDASEDLDVFECPHCKQTIDIAADHCRFCGAKVDHASAQKAAHFLASVDQACSDASYLRNTAGTVLAFLVAVVLVALRSGRLLDRIGFQNSFLGFCMLVLIASLPFPFWAMRWWRKNANLVSDDDEFQSARGSVRTVGFAAAASFVIFGGLLCLILIGNAHRPQ